jgi:O-antigen/teichoic acid export membrane protein
MKKSLRDHAAPAVLWLAIASALEVLLSFVVLAILSRTLAPESFGAVALALSSTLIITQSNYQVFLHSVIQHDEFGQQHLSSVFWSAMAIGVFCIPLVFLLSLVLVDFYDEPTLGPITRALAVLPMVSGIQAVLEGEAQRTFAGRRMAIGFILGRVLGGMTGVALALLGAGVWSLVAQQILLSVVPSCFLFFSLERLPSFYFSWSQAKQLLAFGVRVAPGRLLEMLQMPVFLALCGYFNGATVVGYLDIARRLVESFRKVIWKTVDRVLLPVLSEGRRTGRALPSLYKAGLEKVSLFVVPLFAGIFVTAPEGIPLLFGEKWQPAITPTQGVALTAILMVLQRFWTMGLVAAGRPGLLSVSFGIGVVVLPILMLFLGRYGLDQAVYAWCISGLMMFMLSAFFFSRVFKLSIREIFFPVRTSLLAVGIMMAVLVVVKIELYRLGWMPISVFVTVILLGGFVYLLASVLLNRRLVVDCITFMKKML